MINNLSDYVDVLRKIICLIYKKIKKRLYPDGIQSFFFCIKWIIPLLHCRFYTSRVHYINFPWGKI
ncbi:hypothetical protein EG347_20835 [Chryseobacterium sp. G0186]|nr:hypothetical protein EG347_20835 [Chryseobacterium sp. G0186]